MGLRKTKCRPSKTGCEFGAMAVARGNRVAKVLTGIAHRHRDDRVPGPARDHRSRLQRFGFFICTALLLITRGDHSRAAETKIWEEFSGEKALAHVQRLVDLGPHPAGSEAIEKVRGYIEGELRHSGWQVTRQAFTDDTP